jgi:hypothetical protein
MKVVSLVLSLLLSSSLLLAQSAPAPTITRVAPSTVPTTGGIAVTINGTNLDLPPNFACVAPCPARVSFGGGPLIEVREQSNTQLVVVAPPHAAGTVDVTVVTGDGRSVTAPAALTYTNSGEAQYQMLLLPLYLERTVTGSNGSQWRTDFWISNDDPKETVYLAPWMCPQDVACPAVFPLTEPLKPGESRHNLVNFGAQSSVGRFLYVSRNAAANVSFNLRVADVSRNALDSGTEVPVIRQENLLTKAATLHNVPVDSRFRLMVRVYETTQGSTSFRVSVYTEDGQTTRPDPSATIITASSKETGEFRIYPAVAELDLGSLVAGRTGSVRVVVEPLGGGSRYWAFVSITNNDTQHVTLVTPQ